ncbi:MAG: Stp1/IreP family PP2C-type Ser/Thr phosphatase [Deltaproteobacteria bacterium]|nr:Stp1/IreP family PP2C-type Ser/Thr phosphatase [Deltaproteobacteria bacterium]
MTAITLDAAGRTDVGNEREHNEDSFLLADLSARARRLGAGAAPIGKRGVVLAVCDGMGGAAAGEVASDLAVNTIFEHMTPSDEVIETRDKLASRLETAAYLANSRIHDDATENPARQGMGTTLTAVAVVDDHLVLAHVGDSRAYLLRKGALTQVTRDQSLVAKLVERGTLTEEQALTFEHNNIILQALGASASVIVEMTQVALRRGDRLLLCSDGLSGLVPKDEIEAALASKEDPTAICIRLIDRAKELGGHDNVTAIVGFFEGEALLDDGAPVEVQRYGGGTDLLAIPDPRRLGEVLNPAAVVSGTAVLAAVVPDPDQTPMPEPVAWPEPQVAEAVDLVEDVAAPQVAIPPHDAPPNIEASPVPSSEPAMRPPVASFPEVRSEPAIRSAPLPTPAPTPAPAPAPPSPAARRKGRDPLVVGAVLLGIAIIGGSIVFVLADSRSTSAATKPATTASSEAQQTSTSTWTAIESPPSPSSSPASGAPGPNTPSTTAPPAKVEPKPAAAPRADVRPGPAPRPTASSAPGRRSDLAPIRDDE